MFSCRGCMRNIFNTEPHRSLKEEPVRQLYRNLTGIEVMYMRMGSRILSDQMPLELCMDCYETCEAFVGFRTQCNLSNDVYKKWMLNNGPNTCFDITTNILPMQMVDDTDCSGECSMDYDVYEFKNVDYEMKRVETGCIYKNVETTESAQEIVTKILQKNESDNSQIENELIKKLTEANGMCPSFDGDENNELMDGPNRNEEFISEINESNAEIDMVSEKSTDDSISSDEEMFDYSVLLDAAKKPANETETMADSLEDVESLTEEFQYSSEEYVSDENSIFSEEAQHSSEEYENNAEETTHLPERPNDSSTKSVEKLKKASCSSEEYENPIEDSDANNSSMEILKHLGEAGNSPIKAGDPSNETESSPIKILNSLEEAGNFSTKTENLLNKSKNSSMEIENSLKGAENSLEEAKNPSINASDPLKETESSPIKIRNPLEEAEHFSTHTEDLSNKSKNSPMEIEDPMEKAANSSMNIENYFNDIGNPFVEIGNPLQEAESYAMQSVNPSDKIENSSIKTIKTLVEAEKFLAISSENDYFSDDSENASMVTVSSLDEITILLKKAENATKQQTNPEEAKNVESEQILKIIGNTVSVSVEPTDVPDKVLHLSEVTGIFSSEVAGLSEEETDISIPLIEDNWFETLDPIQNDDSFEWQLDVTDEIYDENKTNCLECNRVLNGRQEKNEHYSRWDSNNSELTTDLQMFSCNECVYDTLNKCAFTFHTKTHTKGVCPYCGKLYIVRGLDAHIKYSHSPTIKCPICDKMVQHDGLKKHRKKYHPPMYRCEVCDKDVRITNRRSHTESHKEKCTFCEQSFASALDLLDHINTHTIDIPTHTNLKKYSCRYCNTSITLLQRRFHEKECESNPKKMEITRRSLRKPVKVCASE